MQLTSGNLTTLLLALNLTEGSYKPEPSSVSLNVQGKIRAGLASSSASFASAVPFPTTATTGPQSEEPDVLTSSGDADTGNIYAQGCSAPSYNAPPVEDQTFPPFDQAKAYVYRYRRQQSVNLGSWFVHEAWMTPSIFACAAGGQISEIDIANGWGSHDGARAVLEQHWDTFINETDFQYLTSIGINTVRLPIGYWNLGPDFVGGTPYESVGDVYQDCWPRIVRAINQLGRAGIGVLVDLHGAPGSQNGQQHSGVSDGQTNLFNSPDYIEKTMNVLSFLMNQLGYVSNVVGIQILNEPQDVPSLPDFYTQAIQTMRSVSSIAATFPLYIHDGFNLGQFSDFVANRSDFVVEDHHSYFVFTPQDDSEPADQHTADVEGGIGASFQQADEKQRNNLVIDEWSCALTDQSLSSAQNATEARRDFCTTQMTTYANTSSGWAFWAYRKEECDDDPGWCFTAAVGSALPTSFFTYGVGSSGALPSQLPDMSSLTAGMTIPSGGNFPTAPVPATSPAPPAPFKRVVQSRPGRRAPRCALRPRGDYIPNSIASPSATPSPTPSSATTTGNAAAPAPSGPPLTRTQQSSVKGYTDGYLTAKIFAVYGLSKLGFVGQYVGDSLAALGPDVVPSGTEDLYRQTFMQGLADGEAYVASGLQH